jgi:hypothetical protein
MALSTLEAGIRDGRRIKAQAPHIVSRHNLRTSFHHLLRQASQQVRQLLPPAGFFEHKDYPLLWIALWTAV